MTATPGPLAFLKDMDDEALRRVYFAETRPGPVRDGHGNLRALTEGETAFLAALKAEWLRRGLHRR